MNARNEPRRFQGTPVFPGIAVGPVLCLRPVAGSLADRAFTTEAEELRRLDAAVQASEKQILQIKDMAARKMGAQEAMIFEAHQMMLTDPEYLDGIRGEIGQGVIVEKAVQSVTGMFVKILSQSTSDYLRERVADLKDVSQRLIRNLVSSTAELSSTEPILLVAEDLAPSDLMAYSRQPLRGVVLTKGGLTSHTAILLKSMGIPSVFQVKDLDLHALTESGMAVLEARDGRLTLNPGAELLAQAEEQAREEEKRQAALAVWKNKASLMRDNNAVMVCSNVANQSQVDLAFENGADGIGLYRTEFLFMDRSSPPSEDEQLRIYQQALKVAAGRPVTLRTMDVGGDKEISYLKMPKEDNPFLGVRGLRLSLQNRGIFETQLRALVRASESGPLEVMFPMVTTTQELEEVFEILKPMLAKKAPGTPAIKWGMMLEIPSNIFMIPEFSKWVQFFSVGTNDLTQYLTACDRMNPNLHDLSDAYSPGVLRAVHYLAQDVRRCGRELSVCGEMASDPLLWPFLFGAGVQKISQNARLITASREALSRWTLEECRTLADRVIRAGSREEARRLLQEFNAF
ncbi:MAG: phosphoenolpyruvate--protein phosphotransferase [Bdellovibrionaceae bacterium]|nr:phosphoenolpyruvate--protein phosphotransferase [Pseudobdellovibrionaceae bacterium]